MYFVQSFRLPFALKEVTSSNPEALSEIYIRLISNPIHYVTLWLSVLKSSMPAMCTRYRASLLNSRSCAARGVWASLKAEILSPSPGFRAKLRPFYGCLIISTCRFVDTYQVVDMYCVLRATACPYHSGWHRSQKKIRLTIAANIAR